MLVYGQPFLIVVVFDIIFAEPMKSIVNILDVFALFPRVIAAPVQPELLETTIAKRLSDAPAHSAVLPLRECPTTATRLSSISASVCR